MDTEHKEVFPLFDSNGRVAEKLAGQYIDAQRTLVEFKEMFNRIEFRKKDYSYLGEEAESKAIQWRNEMINHIKKLESYVDKHFQHCFLAYQESKKPNLKPNYWRLPLPNSTKQ
jgi:hypothetical protein